MYTPRGGKINFARMNKINDQPAINIKKHQKMN